MKNQCITFITGNQAKLAEVQSLLPQVQGKELDLPEIQDVDIKAIIEHKVRSALEQCSGPLIVDDTALYLECMASPDGSAGLPGPLIKWFLKTIGNAQLARCAQTMGSTRARACTMIGYADEASQIHFFEGSVTGTVVDPQGTVGFGWDHIFLPDGYTQTFAVMGFERKNQISPRAQAIQQLREFLTQK